MKASKEFVVGKHNIGFVGSNFKEHFSGEEFESRPMPTFQKLPRSMNDATIESELKPGICELGDVLAFLDNAPQECKDGYWNLFYFSAFVVFVGWDDGVWRVLTWRRDGHVWGAGGRVFSPETGNSVAKASDTLSLESLDARLKKVEGFIEKLRDIV